jgi:Ca2+-binding RTX toxin-like protein
MRSSASTLTLAAPIAVVMVLVAVFATAAYAAVITGRNGSDLIIGTPKRDQIDARGGKDRVNGMAGDDHIVGGLGPDRLYGADGDDTLLDGAGEFGQDRSADIIRGGAGSDFVLAFSDSKAKDLLRCGGGFDRVLVDKGIDRVAEDCEKVRYRPFPEGP